MITFFEELHEKDFNSAIKNRVMENTKKLNKLGLWDVDSEEGGYRIKDIDDFKKNLDNKKLSQSDENWIKTILDQLDSIDDLRNGSQTKTMLIINEFRRKFRSFIDHLDGKNRLQFFYSKKEKNTEEKNNVLDLFENGDTMKNHFFSEIDKVYNKKGSMGLIDRKLLAMSFFCSMVFKNNEYLFSTDDSHMKPETDEIEGIFRRVFQIRTIDACNRMLVIK